MRKYSKRFLSVMLSVALIFTTIAISNIGSKTVDAATKSEIQQSINKLEKESAEIEKEIKELQKDINAQQQLKAAIEKKIANAHEQIRVCNNEIAKINEQIAENKAEIEKINSEIEADKLAFKKHLRAIYMSNSGNNIQILLGAENFSEFLQLSQLTASLSARDNQLLEKLTDAIEALNAKQEENNKLLEEQVKIKAVIAEKQKELESESAQIQSVINKIDSNQSELEQDQADIEKQIKQYEKTLASMASAGGTSFVYDGGDFLWPVPSSSRITAVFQGNDPVHQGKHNGIDIGASFGSAIVAISDGVVVKANNSCTHNWGKSGSCGCGGGYGNYVTINHGTKDGKTYVVTYGHMTRASVSVGQTVKKGQTIGTVGSTGWSTGAHLHFGIAVNGSWVNPSNYYRKVS